MFELLRKNIEKHLSISDADYAMSYPTLLLDTGSDMLLIEQGYSSLEEIFSRIESIRRLHSKSHCSWAQK